MSKKRFKKTKRSIKSSSIIIAVFMIIALFVIGFFASDNLVGDAKKSLNKFISGSELKQPIFKNIKPKIIKPEIQDKREGIVVPTPEPIAKRSKELERAYWCSNGIFNPQNGETDVDCGGSCEACNPGEHCKRDTDCDSLKCTTAIYTKAKPPIDESFCAAPRCDDRTWNGDEEGVDCGGSCSNACPSCRDSDPDNSIFVKGKVIDSRDVEVEDRCLSQAGGIEASCSTKAELEFLTTFEFSCPSDSACQDGRCVPIGGHSCMDPDGQDADGGIHKLTTVTDSTGESKRDRCFSDISVSEAICVNSQVSFETIPCASNEQCVGGICVPINLCSQPNPGSLYPNSQVIQTNVGFHLNTCQDSNTLNTIICRSGRTYVGQHTCEDRCDNGRCDVSDPANWLDGSADRICIDTDQTNDVALRGHVTWLPEERGFMDSCLDLNRVEQLNCGIFPPRGIQHSWDETLLRSQSLCAADEICVPGQGICRRVTSSCQEIANCARLEYTDQDTGEIFRDNVCGSKCDMWIAADSGPHRPRITETASCEKATLRNSEEIDSATKTVKICDENEVCSDRGCIPYQPGMRICSDSDGGVNLQELGTISSELVSEARTDFCQSASRIVEFSCSPDGLFRNDVLNCPSGTVCSGGACKPCIDSDPDNHPVIPGVVEYATGEQQADTCLGEGSTSLIQYSCSEQNGVFIEETSNCEQGEICRNGRCIRE